MARIADKKGRLTKNYRDPTVFHSSSRGRKKYYTSRKPRRRTLYKLYSDNVQADVSLSKSDKNQLLRICLALLLLVVFIIGFPFLLRNSSKKREDSQITTTEISTTEEVIDLSAFEGDPKIEGEMSIVKEYDSSILELLCKVKNNSPKEIETLKIYLVPCYYGDSAIESSKYTDYMIFENLGAWQSQTQEGIDGTITYAKQEHFAYVAYIKYKDGSEWGEEDIDHKKVVSRNAQISLSFEEVEEFDYKK